MGSVVHASSIALVGARVLIAIFSFARLAAAETLPDGFSYDADAECPTAAQFWQTLAGSLEPLPSQPNLAVSLTREPGGYRGRLTVQRSQGPLERRVLAPTCLEAAEAIGIVIEQMSSTNFRELTVAEADNQSAPVSLVNVPAAAHPEPQATRRHAQSVRVSAEHVVQSHLAAAVGASVRSVLPPGGRLGGFGSLNFDWFGAALYPELGLRARWHVPGAVDIAPGTVTFRWWALELTQNVLLRRLSPSLGLRGGATIAAGRLRSQGQDFPGASTAHSLWLSATPELMLRQQLGSRWHLTLALGLDVPIVGAEVSVEGRGVIFRSARLGVVSDFCVGIRF